MPLTICQLSNARRLVRPTLQWQKGFEKPPLRFVQVAATQSCLPQASVRFGETATQLRKRRRAVNLRRDLLFGAWQTVRSTKGVDCPSREPSCTLRAVPRTGTLVRTL